MPLSDMDQEYLDALRKARIAIVTGAQSYTVGSRSLTRADLKLITEEISRLEGSRTMRVRRVIPVD